MLDLRQNLLAFSLLIWIDSVLFRCPNTGFRVQVYLPEQASDDENLFAPVDCLVCKQVHLVDPARREVLGRDRASVRSHSPMMRARCSRAAECAHKLMRRRLATSDQFSALDF
jgi:hypothetical protein